MALTGQQYAKTLVASMIPVADNLRELAANMGLRPYILRMVWVRWTGPLVGRGNAIVERVEDVRPTPNIPKHGTDLEYMDAGAVNRGPIEVLEVSGTYTMEQLMGIGAGGEALDPNLEFFYETEKLRPDGSASNKLRWSLSGEPTWYPGALSWRFTLVPSQAARDRSGFAHG